MCVFLFSIFLQKINIVEHVEEGLKAGEFRHFYKCYVRQNNIHSVLESFLKSLKKKRLKANHFRHLTNVIKSENEAD